MSAYPAAPVRLTLGEVFVNGKTPEQARDLLDAADDLGVDRGVVRTTMHGFIVPADVFDRAAEIQTQRDSEF